MRYLICLMLLVTSSLFAKQGNVIHAYEKGKIQILSEITKDGTIVVLLKPLKSNTSAFKVAVDSKTNVLSFLMIVEQENPICKSWYDCQPVYYELNPKKVSKISLVGKVVERNGNITILMPETP